MAITFKHGPVTITVDGLPASIDPRAVTLDLWISALYDPDQHEAFVRRFRDLGGTATFPAARADDSYSTRSESTGKGPGGAATEHRSRLFLHAPEAVTRQPNDAIARALAAESGLSEAMVALDAAIERANRETPIESDA